MENVNIATVKTNSKDLFKYWLRFTTPMHNLTEIEITVASWLLYKRHLLSNDIKNDKYLNKLLFDADAKEELANEIKVSVGRVHTLISQLRKKGVIIDNGINPKYVPNVNFGTTNFKLLFNFEVDDKGQSTQ